jgi:hypothetical protein
LTNDDEFILKTVMLKESEFLQKLLPGYYMNLQQVGHRYFQTKMFNKELCQEVSMSLKGQ